MNVDLSEQDRAEIGTLWHAWKAARAAKDYKTSDKLRAELETWGCMSPEYVMWRPIYEDIDHLAQRLANRRAEGDSL